MRTLRLTSIAVLLALIFFVSIQTIGRTQNVLSNHNDQELERLRLMAVDIIGDVAREAHLWNDKEATVAVLTDAADLLWNEDPARTKAWLRKAWEQAEQVSAAPRNERLTEFFTASAQSQARVRILTVARKHDPKLAEEFLKVASKKESSDSKTKPGAFDDRTRRSEQLLSLAQLALESNPQEAFTLASSSLADGISYRLQNILTTLRKKDAQLANRLFDLALVRFKSGVPDASEAQVLAGYLFQPGLTFAANSSGQNMLVINPEQQASPPVALTEPQRAKSFLMAVYELLLVPQPLQDSEEGRIRAQNIMVLGGRLLQPYQTYLPELGPSVRSLLVQMSVPGTSKSLTEQSSTANSSDAKSTKASTPEDIYERRVDELEKVADKETNENFRKVAYVEAAIATKPLDYARASAILHKINDSEFRTDAISFIYYRAALFLLREAEVEKAIEVGTKISDRNRRAVVFISVSQRLLKSLLENKQQQSDAIKQRSFDLLIDTGRELKKAPPSSNIAKIMLGYVSVLSQLDREQGLLALEDVVQKINKLEKFDLKDAAAPELGLSVMPSSGATVERPKIGFSLSSAVDSLIAKDFEQVVFTVGRLTTKELNGAARVAVAGMYLQKSAAEVSKKPTRVK